MYFEGYQECQIVSDTHFLKKVTTSSQDTFQTTTKKLRIWNEKWLLYICNTEKIGQRILQIREEVSFTK